VAATSTRSAQGQRHPELFFNDMLPTSTCSVTRKARVPRPADAALPKERQIGTGAIAMIERALA
jgi:hypothetical protein